MQVRYSQLIKKLSSYTMLIIAFFLFIAGLYFAFVPHQFTYFTAKVVSYNGSTCDVGLVFESFNGFFAQIPIRVYGKFDISSDNGNRYESDTPMIFFKDASIESSSGHVVVENTTGVNIPIDSDLSIPTFNLIFPLEGDYEAFLLFTTYSGESEVTVPLERVLKFILISQLG